MYYLYILKCADGSLYTGITTDLNRRENEHNHSIKGAKYTSAHRPVEVVYSKEFENRSQACKEEARVKRLSRIEKLKLIESALSVLRKRKTRPQCKQNLTSSSQ